MATAVASPPLTLETSLDVYPDLNQFALDLTRGRPSAADFVPPFDLHEVRPRPRRNVETLAASLTQTNAAWGNDVASLMEPWQRGETVAMVAGQQVGFGGGPLYTLTKIASLLRLRNELAKRGVAATPFFWLATEDHDLAEVSTLTLATREGFRELRAEARPTQKMVGPLPIPESLRQQLLVHLESSEPYWLSRGLSFGDSFARLIVSVLGSGSIVLVDSLLPALRRAGREIFRGLLGNYREAQALVASRSQAIEAAGYSPQVTPSSDDEYTLLYQIRDGERHQIRFEEAARLAESEPQSISTAALTRPLLQDAVLQPDVFVGGPAELAYYAQATALHEHFGISVPQIALRGHALVAPEKILRAVERYGLQPDELFLPVDELIGRHETDAVAKLNEVLDRAAITIEEQLEHICSLLAGYDRTMIRSADHSLRKMRHQLRRLSERGRRAIARRNAERHNAISRLSDTLLPDGKPQDRVVGWIGYWLQYGRRLVDRLVTEVEPGTDRLKIVGL